MVGIPEPISQPSQAEQERVGQKSGLGSPGETLATGGPDGLGAASEVGESSVDFQVTIPVSRSRAAERGLLRLAPAGLMLLVAVLATRGLRFSPTAVSNRLTEVSIVVAIMPLVVGGLILAFGGIRWLALALWPARVCIEADASRLTLRLGPFGSRAFEVGRLDVRYPFEFDDDGEGMSFEAFMPESEQVAKFLPRVVATDSRERIERTIMAYTRADEQSLAERFRPFTDYVRRDRPPIDDT